LAGGIKKGGSPERLLWRTFSGRKSPRRNGVNKRGRLNKLEPYFGGGWGKVLREISRRKMGGKGKNLDMGKRICLSQIFGREKGGLGGAATRKKTPRKSHLIYTKRAKKILKGERKKKKESTIKWEKVVNADRNTTTLAGGGPS